MFVEVQPCDIKGARPVHARCCPVARAVRRQLGRPVGDRFIICDGGNVWFGEEIIALPEEAVEWLAVFDDGLKRVEPFSFHFDLPEHLTLDYVRGRMQRLVEASSEPRRASGDLRSLRDVLEDVGRDLPGLREAA